MHLLIYNPVSGNSGDECEYLTRNLEKYKVDYKIVYTEESNLKNIKKSLSEASTVIVAGGDGTVSQVMNEMYQIDNKPNFLIYPRGTTNEYASSIGVSKNTFLDYLNNNYKCKSIDMGQYNNKGIFTYSMVFGNFSHIPYETPQWLKNKIGYVAYWLYGFMTLYILKLKQYQMTFKYHEKVIEGKFMFGSVSNSETLGRILKLNNVIYDDGLLELVLIRAPKSIKEVFYFLNDIRTGLNKSGLFVQEKISEISISSPREHSWSADGEFSGHYNNLKISVFPKSLKIIYSK